MMPGENGVGFTKLPVMGQARSPELGGSLGLILGKVKYIRLMVTPAVDKFVITHFFLYRKTREKRSFHPSAIRFFLSSLQEVC